MSPLGTSQIDHDGVEFAGTLVDPPLTFFLRYGLRDGSQQRNGCFGEPQLILRA